ncbi:MAG: amino acid adenylation domain-containing protein [Bacteroidales bacterium]|nr:amino acid adenylation domain-containing protein [Bacteroidales bacterium]
MKDKDLLYKRFESFAHINPQANALKYGDYTITYGDLNSKANRLSNHLIAKGIGTSTSVGLLLEHGPDIPLAILAVAKAGAHYVPISLDDPSKKIRTTLNEFKCNHIISNVSIDIGNDIDVIRIDGDKLDQYINEENPNIKVKESDLTYIMSTSGSTGIPKGVQIEHGNLIYYIDWYINNLKADQQGQLPFTSSYIFAASVTQIYVPLVTGECLHIIPPTISQNSQLLFNWFNKNPNFGLYTVPTLWEEHMIYAKANTIKLPVFLVITGEELKEKLVTDTFDYDSNITIWNLYGPTETVANITYTKVLRNKPINIGKPLEGSYAIIIDEHTNDISNNNLGELCVSGPGVSKGYYNNETLNKKHFTEINGNRYYRTGDIVKLEENNNYTFLGRKDRQVKVNGVRIELGEIESVLNSIEGVRESLVMVNLTGGYDNRLFAFLLTNTEHKSNYYLDILKDIIPPQLIPAFIFTLPKFPKLRNGKTDIKKLSKHVEKVSLQNGDINTSDTKKLIINILKELMNTTEIDLEDNIFDLGAKSITIIKLVNRLNIFFKRNVILSDVYNNPIVKALINFVEFNNDSGTTTWPVKYLNEKDDTSVTYPLTLSQQTLWVIDRTKDTKHAYNIIFGINIPKENISIELLNNTIYRLVEKNDILRSTFISRKGEVVRSIVNGYRPTIIHHNTQDITQREEIIALYNKNLLENSDEVPAKYLLLTYLNNVELIVIVNHIIFDGYSIELFANKLILEYYGSPITSKYTDFKFSLFQKQQESKIQNKSFDEGIEYWVKKLKSNSYTINLPIDYSRPSKHSFEGGAIETIIKHDKKDRIIKFCSNNDVSMFNVFMSAYAILLHKYSNQKDILISYPYANRDDYHYENILGYFVNVILHRSIINSNNSFLDIVKNTKANFIEDSKYMDCPLELVYPELNVIADPSFNPLYQVMFAWHEKPRIENNDLGANWEVDEYANNSSKLDLYLEAQENDNDISLRLNYNSSIFRKQRMDRFICDYLKIIDNLLDNPKDKLDEFSLITTNENETLKNWNNTDHEHSNDLVFYNLFLDTARSNLNKTAVICEDEKYTYQQLLTMVSAFSDHLIKKGISKNENIGVSLNPGIEMLVSLISIQKIGAAYLPLDPGYPNAKIDYIINHSGLNCIISNDANRAFPEAVNVISSDEEYDTCEMCLDTSNASPEDTMYIIYTSGSTGKSKGVIVPNEGVANYLLWMKDCFKIKGDDVFLYQTSINFDISVWELFLPLISGASVVILPKSIRTSSDQIIDIIKEHNVSIVQFVPSALHAFVETHDQNSATSLRRIFVGGERLSNELNNECLNKIDAELINLYGPTEASIFCTYSYCTNVDLTNVSIGKPIYNAKVHILDENHNNIPIGSKGEIYLSGKILANGYLNNTEETNKRFISSEKIEGKLFKTGDIGSFRDDGNIDFWGRVDRQVKLRGYRLELSEIEDTIHSFSLVDSVCVAIREISSSDKRIVAFYTTKNSLKLKDPSELREHCSNYLPEYMVPSEFIFIEIIPTLPNGKIDILSLLNIDNNIVIANENNFRITESNNIESKVRLVWKRVLGHNNFGNDDNFFEVGGHSLLLLKLKEEFDISFDKVIPLVDYYRYTNIKSLAKRFTDMDENNTTINDIRERIANRKKSRKLIVSRK